MGLFAAVDLPAHKIIWTYTEGVDWRIPEEAFHGFPEPYRSMLEHYLYQDESGMFVLCGDNAKFMNHADEPNCDDSGEVHTVTLRPIRSGEELTCDYRLFDHGTRVHGLSFGEQAEASSSGR